MLGSGGEEPEAAAAAAWLQQCQYITGGQSWYSAHPCTPELRMVQSTSKVTAPLGGGHKGLLHTGKPLGRSVLQETGMLW